MEINKRIEQLKEYLALSNSEFSAKIEVQPSALSHIFSERNRPSIDFVLKIKKAFPVISLDWLLLGEGPIEEEKEPSLFSQTIENTPPTPLSLNQKNDSIEKIVFFYKNGTYKIYNA